MNSLKINFENLRRGPFKSVFEALEAGFREFGIDYYIIGAFARDLWLEDNKYLPDRRATLDLDLAVYIAEWKQYDSLKRYLYEAHDFEPDKEPYRLNSPNGLILDLIPFGEIEKGHQVYLDGNPPVQLSVFGTKEVIGQAIAINNVFSVVTLPGLCVMKLTSWSQRPDWRLKDLDDFWYLLENYSDIDSELIFEEDYIDLLGAEPMDIKINFAQILGRQMQSILKGGEALNQFIQQALKRLLEGFSRNDILQLYEVEPKDQKVKRWRLVLAVMDGIKEMDSK